MKRPVVRHIPTLAGLVALWDSGGLGVSGMLTREFNEVGSFPYHCTFHGAAGSGMSGRIVVK